MAKLSRFARMGFSPDPGQRIPLHPSSLQKDIYPSDAHRS